MQRIQIFRLNVEMIKTCKKKNSPGCIFLEHVLGLHGILKDGDGVLKTKDFVFCTKLHIIHFVLELPGSDI